MSAAPADLDAPRGQRRTVLLTALALVAIAVAAALVRFVDLTNRPGGLYPDEAAEGLSALRLLHTPGYYPVWFHDDGGREALFAYIVAAGFRLFGETTLVLRGVAAGMGVAAVLATYLAVRRFGRWPALAATLWTAGSLWLICVSRDGMRNIICVLVGTLALAALLRWEESPSRRTAALAGVYVALGLWTYQPLKLLPFLVILWLWLLRRRKPDQVKAILSTWRWLVIPFALVAAPMIATAIADPANYFGRGADVVAFNPAQNHADLIGHTLTTLGQFFVSGDPNQRHDVGELPLLGWPLSLLAILGVWRAWRRRDDAVHLLVLLALPTFLLPPLIAVEGGSPHFLRNLGLAPYVAVGIGLGCAEAVALANAALGGVARYATSTALAALLVALGAASAWAYFSRPSAAVYDAYTYDLVAMAQAANAGPGAVVIVDDYDATVIRFLDAGNLPTIVDPAQHLDHPGIYSIIVARQVSDITAVTGDSGIATRALPVTFDASGRARVYAVSP